MLCYRLAVWEGDSFTSPGSSLEHQKPSLCNNTMQICENTCTHTAKLGKKHCIVKNASVHIYYEDVHSPTVPHHRLSELRSLINQ